MTGPTIRFEQIASQNQMYRLYSLSYFLHSAQAIGYRSIAFWAGPPHFSIDGVSYGDVRGAQGCV